jgi:hypothetical protein
MLTTDFSGRRVKRIFQVDVKNVFFRMTCETYFSDRRERRIFQNERVRFIFQDDRFF